MAGAASRCLLRAVLIVLVLFWTATYAWVRQQVSVPDLPAREEPSRHPLPGEPAPLIHHVESPWA